MTKNNEDDEFVYDNDNADEPDDNLLRVPTLAELGLFNEKLETSISKLNPFSFLSLLIFDRQKMTDISITYYKANMLIDQKEFTNIPFEQADQIRRDIEIFSQLMYKSFAKQNLTTIGVIIFYFFGAAFCHFQGMIFLAIILILMGLYKFMNLFSVRKKVVQLARWKEQAISHVSPWNQGEDEKPDVMKDSLKVQRYELEQMEKDWSVRLFDMIWRKK